MQVPVHVIDVITLEEQVEVHKVLKLFKPHLVVVTQFVHLVYIDVYHLSVQDVTDVAVM